MSAAPDLLAELMAPFVGADSVADAEATPTKPAKAAKVANRTEWRRLPAGSDAAIGLRISAKGEPGSQVFAGPSQGADCPGSEQGRELSPDSQVSQGVGAVDPSALALVAWTDSDIERFMGRRDRLLRWGWPGAHAEALAERLTRRDREGDPRAACVECDHFKPGRCVNHRRAGLPGGEVGQDLAAMLQRCPGFEA